MNSAPVADRLPPARLARPDIRLQGEINTELYEHFRQALDNANNSELVLELTTLGGDADIGRRIASDVRSAMLHLGKTLWFVGRANVYSAGVTIMSAFPKARRGLSADTTLLVHERKLRATLDLDAGLAQCLVRLEQMKAQIETGQRLEREGFAELIVGSNLSLAEVEKRALTNWYFDAREAQQFGLVGFVFE